MTADADQPLTISQRRRARRLGYWNGAIWGIGNGLTSTTLVVCLAMEFGAKEIRLGIGLIVAAPSVVGILRLGAPAVIGRLVDRKRFCLGAYLLSALVLLGLPLVATPRCFPSARASLAVLVAFWCVYHLLEYLGTIALWSWLADLVPLRIRGRFIGRRQRWLVAGRSAAMLAAGLHVWGRQDLHPFAERWTAYVVPAVLGACFMIAALVPLLLMPRTATSRIVRTGASLGSMLAPFSDRRFLRLLVFGCWFSLSTGLTQSAQYFYARHMLPAAAAVFLMLALKAAMGCGQLTVSPWLGRLADRVGNRPVMFGCLLLVSQGPLFYFFASPEQWWWIVFAWVVWIAYAGLNVCLPNLMLKLSPGGSNTPYIAAYYAVTGLCYAVNVILGGVLSDRYGDSTWAFFGSVTLDYYQCIFLLGWVARSLGLLALLLVIERR